MRQSLGAGALAAIMVTTVSLAVDASPLMTGRSPAEPISSQISLLHRVLIYAKDGSQKLVDGRWNLGQSESKLGIGFSTDETKQLMACTGRIVCAMRDGSEVFGSAASVLRPDLLVTAKHVFSQGRGGAVSFKWCSFRSFSHRNLAIPVLVEKDQRKGYFLNNEDFIVVRLKRELAGCNSFAVNGSDSSLSEGEQVFSVTSYQRGTLNKISSREPVLAKGTIRSVSSGFWGGPPFYYADIDLDEGGSGGAVFALKDGRPVSDDKGQLILRGLLVAHGPRAKNNRPYSDDQNYTIVIGLEDEFRELVKGKAHEPAAVEPAPCFQGGAAKIDVISEPVPSIQSEALAPLLQQSACRRDAAPDPKTGKANANCIAEELKELAKGMKTLAASSRAKERREFRLRNDTSCPICFTYSRCNDYGCWDEVVRASGKSTLFAGVGERAPVIKDPLFCNSGRGPVDLSPPPLPARNPVLAHFGSRATDAEQPAPPPTRKPVETMFLAAKEKAEREGVHTLTSDDIRGLSLEQIKELRGY